MKFIFGIIGFLLLVVAVMVMIGLAYLRRGIIKVKKVMTGDLDDEEIFRRMADKHYRPKTGDPNFDKDYFKRANGSNKQHTPPPGEQYTRRTTTTAEGVTIIDDRVEDNRKKIFDDSEGEYVEYQEVE